MHHLAGDPFAAPAAPVHPEPVILGGAELARAGALSRHPRTHPPAQPLPSHVLALTLAGKPHPCACANGQRFRVILQQHPGFFFELQCRPRSVETLHGQCRVKDRARVHVRVRRAAGGLDGWRVATGMLRPLRSKRKAGGITLRNSCLLAWANVKKGNQRHSARHTAHGTWSRARGAEGRVGVAVYQCLRATVRTSSTAGQGAGR